MVGVLRVTVSVKIGSGVLRPNVGGRVFENHDECFNGKHIDGGTCVHTQADGGKNDLYFVLN